MKETERREKEILGLGLSMYGCYRQHVNITARTNKPMSSLSIYIHVDTDVDAASVTWSLAVKLLRKK